MFVVECPCLFVTDNVVGNVAIDANFPTAPGNGLGENSVPWQYEGAAEHAAIDANFPATIDANFPTAPDHWLGENSVPW